MRDRLEELRAYVEQLDSPMKREILNTVVNELEHLRKRISALEAGKEEG